MSTATTTVSSRYKRQQDQQQQQQSSKPGQKLGQGQEQKPGQLPEWYNQIHSTSSVWLSGLKSRPTVYIPFDLAHKYNLDKKCKIAFFDNGTGITITFLCEKH